MLPSALQCFGLVTNDPLRGPFDAFPQLFNALPSNFLSLDGVVKQAPFERLFGGLQVVIQFGLLRLSQRVIQFVGQKWLSGFGIHDGISHAIQQVIEPLLLLPKFFRDLLTFTIIAE